MTLSAAVEAVRRKVATQLTPEENRSVQQAIQIVSRLDSADNEFQVQTLISDRTGEGRLDCVWLGQVAQMTPEKARETAWILLEAASIAESDAMMHRFLRDRVNVVPEAAAQMIRDLREWRKTEPGHLVPKEGTSVS